MHKLEVGCIIVARDNDGFMDWGVVEQLDGERVSVGWYGSDFPSRFEYDRFFRDCENFEVYPAGYEATARQRMADFAAEDVDEQGRCVHRRTQSKVRAFAGPVVDNYDDQDPRAHGGITQHERCLRCDATRRVNINGWYQEEGEWSKFEEVQYDY